MSNIVVWPELTDNEAYEIVGIPSFLTVAFIAILYNWPAFGQDLKDDKAKGSGEETATLLEAGDQAEEENYSAPWTDTFDLTFLLFMMITFASLCVLTEMYFPELWTNEIFWKYQLPKPIIMISISMLMGYICQYFIQQDANGYIVGKSKSRSTAADIFREGRGQTCCGNPLRKPWFKVNYTRKVQHFAAYLIPLVIPVPESCNCAGTLATAWGEYFTLICFLIMIKPLRENFKWIMVQFNSMDRPEDRPNTLKWIVGGNIIPGMLLILFFRHLYAPTNQQDLALIFVFVTGLGDGLAEPVGVYTGRHKYKVRSCTDSVKYVRSYEGSACVWLSGHIFTALYYNNFANPTQFWVCFWLMGPIMAVAEATSPHTMDTPALMTLGGGLIYACITFL